MTDPSPHGVLHIFKFRADVDEFRRARGGSRRSCGRFAAEGLHWVELMERALARLLLRTHAIRGSRIALRQVRVGSEEHEELSRLFSY